MPGVYSEQKEKICYPARMDEGCKRVLGIIAGILVAQHLKTADQRGPARF